MSFRKNIINISIGQLCNTPSFTMRVRYGMLRYGKYGMRSTLKSHNLWTIIYFLTVAILLYYNKCIYLSSTSRRKII